VITHKLAIDGGTPVRSTDRPFRARAWQGPNMKKYLLEFADDGFPESRFTDAFARAIGTHYAMGSNTCTNACHTAMAAVGVGPGDEVVITPISDYGTLFGILAQRAIPVFADVDPETGCVTGETIARAITPRTKAVFVVHWASTTCDMDPILAVTHEHGLPLAEDCCQSILAKYKGKTTGSIGTIGAFSFDATRWGGKHLGTGSGGALTTDDELIYRRAFNFSTQRGEAMGAPTFGRRHPILGVPYRFDEVKAAVALAQLEILPQIVARRQELARRLDARLRRIDHIRPCPIPEGGENSYWIYSFLVDLEKFQVDLDTLTAAMVAEASGQAWIGPGRYYFLPDSVEVLQDFRITYGEGLNPGGRPETHLGDRYRRDGMAAELPNAKWYVEHMLRFSPHEGWSEQDIDEAATIIEMVAEHYHA